MPDRFARWLTVIVIADAALVLPLLGRTTLWNVDEGRIAEVAREMVAGGDWIVPRLGGEPFGSYPPLAYWLMASSGSALGFNEFAMRLPAALAGLALVAIVGVLGRRLGGDGAGLASAMVLATTPGYFGQQSVCRADVMLALGAVAAFDRFLVVVGGDRRARHYVMLTVALALGVLAKGPLALVIFGLGAMAWLVLHRQWRVSADVKLWACVPATLALVLPWYVAVHRAVGWEFLRLNFLLENVNAFTQGFEHPRPVGYIAAVASYRVVPWVLVLLAAWRVRRAPGLALALTWLVAILFFLTVSSSKRANYLTYLYPAFALSAGIALAAVWNEAPKLVQAGLMIPVGTAFLGAVAIGIAPLPWKGGFARINDLLPMFAAVAAVVFPMLFIVAWRGGGRVGSVALAATMALAFLIQRFEVEPRLDHVGQAGRAFCRRVAAALPAGEALATMGPHPIEGAYQFYVGRPIGIRNGGEPGYYVAPAAEQERLVGRRIDVLDALVDERNRLRLFFRVNP
ncbi:MAG: glycosyltransferase family 39 protein [Planctomycetes bacterium]|nr:glycosyltransferase family 39 protein [Planctomycetota bacterium]